MAQTKADRLVGVGIVPPQAKELVAQFGSSDAAAVAALTPVSTADASDLATAIALANANKAKINAIIAALAP